MKTTPELAATLRALRGAGRLDDARQLLRQQRAAADSAALRRLAWEHEPFWWQPLQGPRVRLQRRGPQDLALVRRCWSDAGFMARFNRVAAPLPEGDEALAALLVREQATIVSEARALHWTVYAGEHALGFVSAANIAPGHRRAEFLIGLHGPCSPWAGPEAAHLALGFLARRAGIERLTAYFYPDNQPAIAAAAKLGFVTEGVLRSYLRHADGRRGDLVVAGLLLNEGYFVRTTRLRRRLLGAAAGTP